MAELSREAMQLLELMPRWELRPEFRPAATTKEPFTIIGLAHSSSAQVLWAAIAKSMIDMGFPRDLVEGAVMLESPQLDRAVDVLLAQRPTYLLAFGTGLIESLHASHSSALQGARIVPLASIHAMIESPNLKATTWSTLHQLRVDLAFER